MAKKKKKEIKREIILTTGLIFDDFENQIHTMQFLESIGEEPDINTICYLCKRKKGKKYLSFDVSASNDEVQFNTPEINMLEIHVSPTEDKTFIYRVCIECYVLLRAIATVEFEIHNMEDTREI